jgi:heat shock protein HslJ
MKHARVMIGLVVASSLLGAGCGDDADDVGSGGSTTSAPPSSDTTAPDGGGSSADDLVGRTFVSTSVSVDGTDAPLVDGTQLEITFEAGDISVNAGCNTMFGGASLDDGTLTVDSLGQTEMGCEQPLMAQDTMVADFLSSSPTWTLDGDTLVLTGADGMVITLTDREVADPDRDLVGPLWTVESLVDSNAVSSIAAEPGTLQFGDDGTVTVFDGCNNGSGSYTATDDTLTFGPIAMTQMACLEEMADEMQAAVGAVLASPEVTYSIEADQLSLRTPEGVGLDLRADA